MVSFAGQSQSRSFPFARSPVVGVRCSNVRVRDAVGSQSQGSMWNISPAHIVVVEHGSRLVLSPDGKVDEYRSRGNYPCFSRVSLVLTQSVVAIGSGCLLLILANYRALYR